MYCPQQGEVSAISVVTFQSKCSRYRRLLSSEFLRCFLLPSWHTEQVMVKHIQCKHIMRIFGPLQRICCNLTVPHSLWVFIRERRGKASPLTFTAPRVGRRALRLWLLGLRLDWLGLVNLLRRLTVAVLFLLAPLVGQLPVLRRRGHLVGLFHFEEHWRGGTVLHGPEFKDRGRTILGSQHYDVTVYY